MPWAELAADTAPVQNVAQDLVHVPWLLPVLETSATAISATVVTNHSSSGTVCRKPRRWSARPACPAWGPARRTVPPEPAWIFSRGGISSPDASRVNMVSRATSAGSELASLSLIESRAFCSHALRLITDPSITSPWPERSQRHGEHCDD